MYPYVRSMRRTNELSTADADAGIRTVPAKDSVSALGKMVLTLYARPARRRNFVRKKFDTRDANLKYRHWREITRDMRARERKRRKTASTHAHDFLGKVHFAPGTFFSACMNVRHS